MDSQKKLIDWRRFKDSENNTYYIVTIYKENNKDSDIIEQIRIDKHLYTGLYQGYKGFYKRYLKDYKKLIKSIFNNNLY